MLFSNISELLAIKLLKNSKPFADQYTGFKFLSGTPDFTTEFRSDDNFVNRNGR